VLYGQICKGQSLFGIFALSVTTTDNLTDFLTWHMPVVEFGECNLARLGPVDSMIF